MKVTELGLKTKEYVNQQTGIRRFYTDLFFKQDFTDAEKRNGSVGEKCGAVTTTLDCSGILPGDVANLDYGPTGYRNQDGSEQIRLLGIEVLQVSVDQKK